MRRTIAGLVGFAVSGAGTAVIAGPTWTPNGSTGYGSSYVYALANDGSNSDGGHQSFNAFGSYSATGTISRGSFTNAIEWNANASHSDYTLSVTSGTTTNDYLAFTVLTFTADADIAFDVTVAFDWQGSGQDGIETKFEIYDITAGTNDYQRDVVSSGPVSSTYSGSFVQAHDYYIAYYAEVYGSSANISGSGTGSGDITLNVIPLPSVFAMGGIGLLGLGARRRLVSL